MLLGASWIYAAYQAELENRDIPGNWKRDPLTPVAGYASGVLFVGAGATLLIRWIQLVRRPPDK